MLPGLWRGRGLVYDLAVGGDGEEVGWRLTAIDFADGDDLLAGAGVVVLDDHVDGEVGRVPVFVVDDDTGVREALASLIGSVGLRVECFAAPPEFLRRRDCDDITDARISGAADGAAECRIV